MYRLCFKTILLFCSHIQIQMQDKITYMNCSRICLCCYASVVPSKNGDCNFIFLFNQGKRRKCRTTALHIPFTFDYLFYSILFYFFAFSTFQIYIMLAFAYIPFFVCSSPSYSGIIFVLFKMNCIGRVARW